MQPTDLTRIIKEIGRGKNAARDLQRDDARALFVAMLAGAVPDLPLGAVLMALRIKGESLEELAGFLEACEACYPHLQAPAGAVPLVIPAYNGARQLPNLTPLLAHLVARAGVPVLVRVARFTGFEKPGEFFERFTLDTQRHQHRAQRQIGHSARQHRHKQCTRVVTL